MPDFSGDSGKMAAQVGTMVENSISQIYFSVLRAIQAKGL